MAAVPACPVRLYTTGTAFAAFSSIAEKTSRQIRDGGSLSFLAGLTEGVETVAVHRSSGRRGGDHFCLALLVMSSGVRRIHAGYRSLQ